MNDIWILTCCIAAREGKMVAEQFSDWAAGAPLSEQNGNAMFAIRKVLGDIAATGNRMSAVAETYFDDLDPTEINRECQ